MPVNNPSQYAGIAAVFVFGVGLLIIGKTWTGITILGVGVFLLGFALAPSTSAKALFIAIGALVCCAALSYQAALNEVTGRAIYHHGFGRGSRSEPVTREDSPAKFREATNLIWGFSIASALVGVCGFIYYRKDHASDDFP
jgi:hypothetical protein